MSWATLTFSQMPWGHSWIECVILKKNRRLKSFFSIRLKRSIATATRQPEKTCQLLRFFWQFPTQKVTYLSTYLPIYLPTYLPIYLSTYLSILIGALSYPNPQPMLWGHSNMSEYVTKNFSQAEKFFLLLPIDLEHCLETTYWQTLLAPEKTGSEIRASNLHVWSLTRYRYATGALL